MIKTLSIPPEMEDFLKDNPDLSPSKMLQSKIQEIIQNRTTFFPILAKKDAKIEQLSRMLQEKCDELNELIEKCGSKK